MVARYVRALASGEPARQQFFLGHARNQRILDLLTDIGAKPFKL